MTVSAVIMLNLLHVLLQKQNIPAHTLAAAAVTNNRSTAIFNTK